MPIELTHLTITLFACGAILVARAAPVRAAVEFETEVKPIREAACLRCHDEQNAEGDLRLDSLKGAIAGGAKGPSIVPSDAAKSTRATSMT